MRAKKIFACCHVRSRSGHRFHDWKRRNLTQMVRQLFQTQIGSRPMLANQKYIGRLRGVPMTRGATRVDASRFVFAAGVAIVAIIIILSIALGVPMDPDIAMFAAP
jgi:hypothetical protein